MKIAQQIVETLLEGDDKKMPDWLKKKISGKKDGDDNGDEKGEDKGGEKKSDEKDDDAKPSDSVASVTGSKKAKGGDKVEHTF